MLEVSYFSLDKLIPYARNSRTHSEAQVEQIAKSIGEFGFTNPVLIDEKHGIIAGHGRVLAAQKLELNEIPCIVLKGLTEAQKRAYVIADNKIALNAGWDEQMLALELNDLKEMDFDLELIGFTFDDEQTTNENNQAQTAGNDYSDGKAGGMADKFIIPPFTVFNAREGWWQDRKRSWIARGIESEEGRADNLISYSKVSTMGEKDTSIFDPVLCEIAYRWFTPANGVILDPFAGGSVRGIIASLLGRTYIGGELRQEQVDANRKQAEKILGEDNVVPVWHCADSRYIDKTCQGLEADFVFSCPPYADLEVYSDDPADLSTLDYAEFRAAYFEIIAKACSLLKQDRFAAFVVGEVRDKKGFYYDFVGDTIQAFRDAGLEYYNEAILVTAVGSLPLRAGRMFSASRKLGKTHQNVLVFVKGDPKKAVEACGDVDVTVDVLEEKISDEYGEQL